MLLSTLIRGVRRGFRRLAVEPGSTSFYEGREFRTYKEWSTATTTTYVIKAVTDTDTVLLNLTMNLIQGSARMETITGGTEGGSFSETLPVIPANTMSEAVQPVISPQNVLSAGGTITGGTILDVFRLNTSANTVFAGSVGGDFENSRGVPPGTYYFKLQLTDAIGILKARWEERP